jgi:hypothetical protein
MVALLDTSVGAALKASSICRSRGVEASTKRTSFVGSFGLSRTAALLDRTVAARRAVKAVFVHPITFMFVSFAFSVSISAVYLRLSGAANSIHI